MKESQVINDDLKLEHKNAINRSTVWPTTDNEVREKGVPQSQAAANPRHEEEEETDKTKQAQIEQTYEKH